MVIIQRVRSKTADAVHRLFQVTIILAAAAGTEFLYLSKLHQFFVSSALDEPLEFGAALYVAALDTSEIASTAHFWNDASGLYTLGEASNDVGATFVIIFDHLNVGCHMWARAYH